MPKDIEQRVIDFVCTANYMRSPIAELVAQWYLKKINEEIYRTVSSGSHVNAINMGARNLEMKQLLIEKAMERGDVYTPSIDHDIIKDAFEKRNDTTLDYYFNIAYDLFCNEERSNRAAALKRLKKMGIEGEIKREEDREQTKAYSDRVAVFSMTEYNNNVVKELYRYHPIKEPMVSGVLSKFATGDKEAELPDHFGNGTKTTFKVVDRIVEEVQLGIDKLLNQVIS